MPRSVDEILRHADELAACFENYEPDPSDELDPSPVTALRTAVLERSDAERHLLAAIQQARAAHLSWSGIGALVGTSGEAARQRYANKVAWNNNTSAASRMLFAQLAVLSRRTMSWLMLSFSSAASRARRRCRDSPTRRLNLPE